MVMKDDLKRMKRVLKYMGHVDGLGVIQLKGRTACEINTANELVATELTFSGVFNEFSTEQIVALLSCFTFDEKSKGSEGEDPAKGLRPLLAAPFKKLQDAARVIAKANLECKIECDTEEFIGQFNPGLMEAVYAWCKGAKFVDVQKLTDTYEGTTIRTLRRLEELVRQLASASDAVGNMEMKVKFEQGSELLKRDIVFTASLYL
jgi:ATP-dependent RNA helicase DOB1